eukprot:CAMPEP_0171282850 /NCGR_PEP_ID=MMETSP0790-20130122/67134_1 /TAXON_ID=2925 /ORGANISM="Alexandrium catenella, Strain OF101" /LENGTH=50 /DNA_ID=CAMNT_0011752125 /DNA_START=94 /DNA_END=242 /DNA_ORIENTATION=-
MTTLSTKRTFVLTKDFTMSTTSCAGIVESQNPIVSMTRTDRCTFLPLANG